MLVITFFFFSPSFEEFGIVAKKVCQLFPTETEVKLLYLYILKLDNIINSVKK